MFASTFGRAKTDSKTIELIDFDIFGCSQL